MCIRLAKCAVHASMWLAICTPANSLAGPRPKPLGDLALVAKLYKDFAWQALGTTQAIFGKPLQQQDDTVLRRYFDPLFGSQDAAVTDFAIQREDAGRIAVAFTSPSSGEKVRLLFHMRQAGAAWRINDIVYQDLRGASLRKVLSAKLPGNK